MNNKTGTVIKTIIAVVVVAAVAVAGIICGVKIQNNKLLKEYEEAFDGIPEGVMITAHTGCVGTDDNSLQSIAEAAKYADICEFDLNFDKSGMPVLSHDKVKGGEVTLEEALAEVAKSDTLKVNIDLKSFDDLPAVDTLVEKYGLMDRVFYTGVHEEEVATVKSMSKIPYYLNMDIDKKKSDDAIYINGVLAELDKYGAIGVNCQYNGANEAFVEGVQKAGYEVSLFTVDKLLDMYKVISYAPNNITTRKPDVITSLAK